MPAADYKLPPQLKADLMLAKREIEILLMPPPGREHIRALHGLMGTAENLHGKLSEYFDSITGGGTGAPSAKRARLADEDDGNAEDRQAADAPLIRCNSRRTTLPAVHPQTGGSRVGSCSVCDRPLDLDDLASCWCEATPRSNMLGHGTPRPCRKCGWAYSVEGCGCKSDGSLESDDSNTSE